MALARQIWAADQAGLNFQSLVFVDRVADEREADKPARQRAWSEHGAGPEGQKAVGQSMS
jgi:hypothetical protein